MKTPLELVQAQLEAYNRRDVEAFTRCFSPTVVVQDLLGTAPRCRGAKEFRANYEKVFAENLRLHCKLVHRIVQDQFVIDEEYVTGIERLGNQPLRVAAIYFIDAGLIQKVWFTR